MCNDFQSSGNLWRVHGCTHQIISSKLILVIKELTTQTLRGRDNVSKDECQNLAISDEFNACFVHEVSLKKSEDSNFLLSKSLKVNKSSHSWHSEFRALAEDLKC